MKPVKQEIEHITDLIGVQHTAKVFTPDVFKQLEKVVLNNQYGIEALCMDIFTLGYMHGKHDERNKKSPVSNNGTVKKKETK